MKIADFDLRKKAEIIHNELPSIYKKIEEKELLPKEVNLDVFMKVGMIFLNQAYQEAQFGSFFTVF